jgi:7,8-dihydro-6-hydroxymethylpterin-pyrophosphokinase
MTKPQSKKKPMSHDNGIIEETQTHMSAKKVLRKCKEYESQHEYQQIRVDPRTVILKRVK